MVMSPLPLKADMCGANRHVGWARSEDLVFMLYARNVCHYGRVNPFQIQATSFGFDFRSHIWPDRFADHEFARTGGSDQPRAQIHSLAQCCELVGPALRADRTNKSDTRVDTDAD